MEKIFSRKVAETKSVHLRAAESAVIFIEKKDFNWFFKLLRWIFKGSHEGLNEFLKIVYGISNRQEETTFC